MFLKKIFLKFFYKNQYNNLKYEERLQHKFNFFKTQIEPDLTLIRKNIQKKEKEKKMRVETNTWGLDNEDLAFETQLELLRQICQPINEIIRSS